MVNNIEILVKNVGLLEISSKDVESFGVPLVFNLTDISDVSSRKASYSKTIKILGSKQNNLIFNYLYEIKGQHFDLKMGNKHDCVLLVNKNPVMDGYFVLKQITKLLIGNKYQIVYEINMFDELKNFFNDLGDKNLFDLDFSSGFTFNDINYGVGDHVFNEQELGDRMNSVTDYTDIYDYPVIDYGYKLKNIAYGLTGFPRSSISFGTLYPCVYQKPILDRIFYESSDYSYESEYFNGNSYGGFFKNMINIYNEGVNYTNLKLAEYLSGGIIIEEENLSLKPVVIDLGVAYSTVMNNGPLYIENRYAIDSYFTETSVDGTTELSENIDPLDPYNHIYELNSGLSGFTAPNDGNYNIKFKVDVNYDAGGFEEDGNGGYIAPIGGTPTQYDIIRYVPEDGKIIVEYNINSFDMRPVESDTSWYYENEYVIEDVSEGDIIGLVITKGVVRVGAWPGAFILRINMAALEMSYIRELEGDYATTTTPQINLNSFLPDMKQTEFIKNHIKLANLYIWSNKEDPKKLYIEPRDDFYKMGSVINWSEKVDYNKNIVIKSLNDDIAKTYTFEYSKGSDYKNENYLGTYDEVYGTKTVDVENNFLINEQNIKLDNQSFLMDNYFLPIYGSPSNFMIPKLYEDSEHTWFDDKSSFEPLWGFKDNFIDNPTAGLNIKLAGFKNFNVYNQRLNNIPIVTHAKVMGGLSFDVNYETNNETFTISGYDSSRGAYKIFWENYINNITDEDARIVEIYINLDLSDILNLDFRNRILIDGQIYFLQKVEYDAANSSNSSKITLLKEIDPIEEGSFETFYLLKNDNNEYITTSDSGNKIIIN